MHAETPDGASTPLVRIRGAAKAFEEHVVLRSVDLDIEAGQSVAILGPSGTGKSVLLKILIGLLSPDDGEVSLWGSSVTDLDEEAWLPLRRRMGFVFQSGALFDAETVFDNVAYPLREYGERDEDAVRETVEEWLDWVGLAAARDKLPSELSGGMRKRVALARSLAPRPELVLYDEPTTGLDPATGRKVSCLIRDTARKLESTSIVVTHDVDCARIVADRWIFLSGGEVLEDGRPEDLFACEREELRTFLAPWAVFEAATPPSPERS